MNINDFLLTVGISLFIGIFVGFFLRDMLHALRTLYTKRFKRSAYFELDTKQEE
ncbi:hypothetical protein RJD38_20325 [Vibrio scophthalmi]|uniref:Uncharacterized protein n=1 Tax=Vibrio scophthalmi TaxID=45658 RepID=A0A1C7FGS6_9VIBR|nr:hypothetical protein [Vibrio scophthalmi]ANU38554.1 hypothetical protein VSVS05_03516 [Vibrio scophthalmi]